MLDIVRNTPKTGSKAGNHGPSKKSTHRQFRGGVSPRLGVPATRGLDTIGEPLAVPQNAAAFNNFSYHGGPVVKCPNLYATFWGNQWLTDPGHLERAGRLTQFLSDLVHSEYMNVLSQYGVGFGAGLAGFFARASFLSAVPTTLTDPAIQGLIQDCINAGALPEPTNPSNVTLIIYLDDTIGVNDPNDGLVMCEPSNDTAFGYHGHFVTAAGNPFYYAVIPALSDACLSESCPGNDGGCSLHLAEDQEARLTQVTSHEFAEMTTDPEGTGWWDSDSGQENGDICNGAADTITVGANTWTVQRQYSKTDDINSNGSNFCVTTAPTALPKLVPGPAAVTLGRTRIEQLHGLKTLLPLPPVYFNLKSKKLTMDEAHVGNYIDRLFRPFQHEQLVPDLSGLLRTFADYIDNAK